MLLHAPASAYVTLDGRRITLAVIFVLPGHDMNDVVSLLMHRVRALGLKTGRLWLDCGFATVTDFEYRRDQRLTAVDAGRTAPASLAQPDPGPGPCRRPVAEAAPAGSDSALSDVFRPGPWSPVAVSVSGRLTCREADRPSGTDRSTAGPIGGVRRGRT